VENIMPGTGIRDWGAARAKPGSGTAYELKPGCEFEFTGTAKQVIGVEKRTNNVPHWIAYNVRAGASLPTILFVSPMRSLAEQDREPPAAPIPGA
jgi:hypothetical protein